ncbi:MAG: bifunctional diguanylate cyclase/phosphodiesterase, partial [Halopseudomonas sp.]
FKRINDSMGHLIGDRLLQKIANRLNQSIRSSDTIARLGGDEFTVILDDINRPEDAALLAEKLLHKISSKLVIDGHEMFVSCSVGISLFPLHGDDNQTLIKYADIAMYQAKEEGKNCYRFYNQDMSDQNEARLQLETELRHAVSDGEISAYYQPKVCIKTKKIVGFEALARWYHTDSGFISPAVFIPLAEEIGLVGKIDLAILEQACKEGKRWAQQGHNMKIAVNISGNDFNHPDFLSMVRRALEQSDIDPQYLELEITEGVLIGFGQAQLDLMRQLVALGVSLAIDDFGTGYSSLSYLKKLPVQTLKIDRSFIKSLDHDRKDQVLVAAIINMAHSLGLTVVAEGVEELSQLTFLEANLCDMSQGYLCSPPIPADQAFELLVRTNATCECTSDSETSAEIT